MEQKYNENAGGNRVYTENARVHETLRLYNKSIKAAAVIQDFLVTEDRIVVGAKSIVKGGTFAATGTSPVVSVKVLPGGTSTGEATVATLTVDTASAATSYGTIDSDADTGMVLAQANDLIRVEVTTAGGVTAIRADLAIDLAKG